MMLIYLNVSASDINSKPFIKEFGQNPSNMNLSKISLQPISPSVQKSRIQIQCLAISINLFSIQLMENSAKSDVKLKLNLLLKKRWKTKICSLMMSLNALSSETNKFAIKSKNLNKKVKASPLIISPDTFSLTLNKS